MISHQVLRAGALVALRLARLAQSFGSFVGLPAACRLFGPEDEVQVLVDLEHLRSSTYSPAMARLHCKWSAIGSMMMQCQGHRHRYRHALQVIYPAIPRLPYHASLLQGVLGSGNTWSYGGMRDKSYPASNPGSRVFSASWYVCWAEDSSWRASSATLLHER